VNRLWRSESGQTAILTLGFAMLVFAVAGVAIDGTRAFLYRRTLQNAADASALAGAGELDTSVFYRSGGTISRLRPADARRVALEWLAKRGLRAQPSVVADDEGLEVELRGRVTTSFLSLIGLRHIPVATEARAEPIE
jgi:Putative Flp pilus-assembly TadE/G-like